MVRGGQEGKVGITYRVITAKSKAEAKGLVQVDRICVQNADVHFPLFEVGSGDEIDTWGKGLLDLRVGRSVGMLRSGARGCRSTTLASS